jgi:hypothetical protein
VGAAHQKDLRAAQIIKQFAKRLRELGDGVVPEHWRQLVAAELSLMSLSGFIKQFTPPKSPPARGRPKKWSADENAKLISMVDATKAELLRSKNAAVSDREAIRYLLQDASGHPISEHQLKSTVILLSKQLSRARPPALRRRKRTKSQK